MRRLFGLMIVGFVMIGVVSPVYGAADSLFLPGDRVQAGGEWRCVEVNGQVDLNIRGGPGLDYNVVTSQPSGAQLEADYSRLESAGGYNWIVVRYSGGEGWAITARLSPCESDYDDPEHNVVLESINDDGTLDRFEIAAIAQSVVLLANVQDEKLVATGTGTIITPDGLIVTNEHVIEDADIVAIGLLNDINDPPEYRYLAEIVNYSDELDVALIAIRYDLDGHKVSADSLNLPYIPSSISADEVFRGDPVYIFGYPGIGDDYLVVTTGSIVSVENGNIEGQRLPVWYRTDAEIAPGNSGGLVVNGNGGFVGIPTFVTSEEETGGRLGGIRPAEVALLGVLDNGAAMAADPSAATPVPNEPDSSDQMVVAQLQSVTTEHGTVVEGQAGLEIHVAFSLEGWAQQDATLFARFYYDDIQSTPLTNPTAPGQYQDRQHHVLASLPILPCCEQTIYDDLILFIPYEVFGLTQSGQYALKYRVEVSADDNSWRRTLSWEYFTFTVR